MNNVRRPNIIFVLTDDQGYGDLGCTGNPWVITPNIDAFYAASMRFTNFHAGPTCAPARSGLMTGHYANSTGVWHTIGGRSLLRKNEWTIASALKEHGYTTGIFGKWHLGDEYPYRPHDRGFDTSIVHGGGGIGQTPDFWGNDYFDDNYYVNGEVKKFQGYCTDVFFKEALMFIESNNKNPFFCFISTNTPHAPYNVASKYYDMYKRKVPDERARFYGMITNIDENFGVLKQKIRQLELEQNTILIFMTDNGTSAGAEVDSDGFVLDGYNAGMRGKKGSEYDGGHRVPFFIQWPNGGIQGGTDIGKLTANVDFMPTLLDLCNISVKEGINFHGKSLAPLLYGETEDCKERIIVIDSQRVPKPVKWKQSSIMTEQWRLVNATELYDINVDCEQKKNIAEKHPDVIRLLRLEYEKWWDIVSAQFYKEIPISIGVEPVTLTSHDWRNNDCSCAWNQGLIRKGLEVNGYWEIHIEKSGWYTFELRRWPKETNRAIVAGIDGNDIKWEKKYVSRDNWWYYCGGKALNLTNAAIEVQQLKLSREIRKTDCCINFFVELQEGHTHLKTSLTNDKGTLCLGAYYVHAYKNTE